MWLNEIKSVGCLDDAVVRIRISDNVLDDEDWSSDLIVFRTGIVVAQTQYNDGCYRMPNMVGWDTMKFAEWLAEDYTGQHPENYHEYRIIE